MHPVITILGFIVWLGFLSRGSPRMRVNEWARIVSRSPGRAGEALASVFESVVKCADAAPIKRVRIADVGSPSLLQWGVLGGVVALLLALQNGL